MKKRSRKLISILLTLSLLVTLLVPLATPAAAAGTYSAVSAPTVSDEGNTPLGRIKVEFDTEDVGPGSQTLYFKLPSDFTYFPDTVDYADIINPLGDDDELGVAGATYVRISAYTGDNAITDADISIARVADDEFRVVWDGNTSAAGTETNAIFYVDYLMAYVPSHEGDITIDIESSGNDLDDGSVVLGKTSDGEVEVSAVDTSTANSNFQVTLRIKENVTGALSNEADSLKFILPDGFEWSSNYFDSASLRYGDDLVTAIAANDFTRDEEELSFNPGAESTTDPSCFELTLNFEVVDEEDVTAGDIEMKIKGESTVTPATLVVGKYGDYSSTAYAVDADDLPTVYTGKVEQEVSDITIEESIADSLTLNRNVTFELPSFARWSTVPDTVTDSGVTLNFAGISGSEGNVVKYTVDANAVGGDAAELEFEDMEVLLDVAAPGDLTVTVGGNAGVEGEFAIAKLATSVAAKAEAKPEVKIGLGSQKLGDITITETEAGAIEDDKDVILKVPAGMEFTKAPTVEVTEGDLSIDQTRVKRSKTGPTGTQPTDYYQYLYIPIDNDSNEVSTIKITDIYVNVDRTVAEGDVKVAVLGTAIIESNGRPVNGWFNDDIDANGDADIDNDGTGEYDASTQLFPNTAAYTAAVAGVVSTPAPGEYKANASFVIGSTTYKIAGVEMTMDVAPYVKDGRTFLPVRYVAQTLGVADANILWDDASQKVTLIKDGTVVQLTIGSNVLLLNGAAITMDVAPELTSDRTMLPIRFIAQAFGATVGWDEATQTVTLN